MNVYKHEVRAPCESANRRFGCYAHIGIPQFQQSPFLSNLVLQRGWPSPWPEREQARTRGNQKFPEQECNRSHKHALSKSFTQWIFDPWDIVLRKLREYQDPPNE
jgi:hypothetical protein